MSEYWGVWNRSGRHAGLTTDDRVLIGDFDYGPFASRDAADEFVRSLGRFGENKWVARIPTKASGDDAESVERSRRVAVETAYDGDSP